MSDDPIGFIVKPRLCTECGEPIHEGAISCAKCGADAPSIDASPEAADQQVCAQLSELHPERSAPDEPPNPFDTVAQFAMTDGDPVDLALTEFRMAKVERDASGKVIWDPKNALIGGLVVAITVGLFVFWLTAIANTPPSTHNQTSFHASTTVH